MTARPTQAEVGDRRINYDFQVFKAICITLICAGHIWNTGFDGPFDLFPIYSFHVAAFAFVSGYFYKPNNDAEPAHFIVRKARALLVPTFIAMSRMASWLSHCTVLGSTGREACGTTTSSASKRWCGSLF